MVQGDSLPVGLALLFFIALAVAAAITWVMIRRRRRARDERRGFDVRPPG